MKVMVVPINHPKRHNDLISGDIRRAIERVLSRGWYVLGPESEKFEAEFAAYCGVGYCIGLANGTDALELALRALEVKPGDHVATVANAGMYSTTAIKAIGAEPVYVDVDPFTMNMDAEELSAALTPHVTAIIVTHLYGRLANVSSLLEMGTRAGIPVIEDCSQGHGIQFNGKRAGSFGHIGCFSFYPTKNLGALGDGGAAITSDFELARRLRMLRQYGWESKYRSSLAGGRNSRLDEIQAAVLRVKLPYLDGWNEQRRKIAWIYSHEFRELNLLLPPASGGDYIAHLYVIRTSDRENLKERLAVRGINTDIHYPVPDHLQLSVRSGAVGNWSLPITEKCSREVLTLPCFLEMTDEEVDRVITAIKKELSQDNVYEKTNDDH